jgi:hypothetical protein
MEFERGGGVTALRQRALGQFPRGRAGRVFYHCCAQMRRSLGRVTRVEAFVAEGKTQQRPISGCANELGEVLN